MAIDPITIYVGVLVSRMLAPVVKDGWRKLTKAEKKEEDRRLKIRDEDIATKLMLQRQNHEDRLREAEISYQNSMKMWTEKTYYERCWPLRNPFEMQICQPISDDKSYFGGNIIVPCRLISALKDSDHPYARTINGNLSSFVVNHYPTNSVHAVVSEIGAWKDEAPSNDASINYLYAGLKKQPVMVMAPTLINDGKTFIFKVWSWGLGEELNYPAGFEFGRLELKPLYLQTVYLETLQMAKLAKDLDKSAKFFSAKLQHNLSIVEKIQDENLSTSAKQKLMTFLTSAPELDEAVKEKMERTVSGIFCCMAGMYADAYHLLEYKTLPKLPSLLAGLPGVEYMLPSLKEYYLTLLSNLERIESDKMFLSQIYLDVANAFCKLKQRHLIVEPFLEKSLRLYAVSENVITSSEEDRKSFASIVNEIEQNPVLMNSEYIKEYRDISESGSLRIFHQFD